MPLSRADMHQLRRQGDSITWHMECEVEKYSPDQVAFAVRRFREERAWRRGCKVDPAHMVARLRYGKMTLQGSDFERYFPRGGEEGHASAPGNILVNAGLTNLISLWLGLTGTAINHLTQSAATACVGVGTGTSAPATTDITLISNNGSAWYQAFDASTLTQLGSNGIQGTCTVGSANANFAWNEWCWATGTGLFTAGSNGTSVAGSPYATANSFAMVNHKTNVNLGSKASGSSWVFSTTMTIS